MKIAVRVSSQYDISCISSNLNISKEVTSKVFDRIHRIIVDVFKAESFKDGPEHEDGFDRLYLMPSEEEALIMTIIIAGDVDGMVFAVTYDASVFDTDAIHDLEKLRIAHELLRGL